MRILVTGGAGFIGSNLALTLQKKFLKAEITIVDDFRSGDFKNLIDFEGEIITLDLSLWESWEYLRKNFRFDVIFHCAAITDTTVHNQKEMMEVNTNVFKFLIETAIKDWKATHIIYSSSAAVYGNCPVPMKEEGCLKPENIYGFSKLAMDRIALNYMQKKIDTNIVGLRYFNVYGPRESHKGKTASMVYQLIKKMANNVPPRIFKWGEQKRDFVYIKDVIRANLLALEKNRSGIYNVGTGQARSFNELIEIINQVLGTNFQPIYFDNPYPFYQNLTLADLTKISKELGYKPQWSLEEGVKDYVNWLKENREIT